MEHSCLSLNLIAEWHALYEANLHYLFLIFVSPKRNVVSPCIYRHYTSELEFWVNSFI